MWLRTYRSGERTCKHTDFVAGLLVAGLLATPGPAPVAGGGHEARAAVAPSDLAGPTGGADAHPYVQAIVTQFPGLAGRWRVAERRGAIGAATYRVA